MRKNSLNLILLFHGSVLYSEQVRCHTSDELCFEMHLHSTQWGTPLVKLLSKYVCPSLRDSQTFFLLISLKVPVVVLSVCKKMFSTTYHACSVRFSLSQSVTGVTIWLKTRDIALCRKQRLLMYWFFNHILKSHSQ